MSISIENWVESSALGTTLKPSASRSSVEQALSAHTFIEVTGHSFVGKIVLPVEKTSLRLKVSQSVSKDLNLSMPAKKAFEGASFVMT